MNIITVDHKFAYEICVEIGEQKKMRTNLFRTVHLHLFEAQDYLLLKVINPKRMYIFHLNSRSFKMLPILESESTFDYCATYFFLFFLSSFVCHSNEQLKVLPEITQTLFASVKFLVALQASVSEIIYEKE